MAGQTLSRIRAHLDSAGLSPQHRFGQNFLIDLNLMRKLVDAADVGAGDVVLEVGCGTGSLTEILLERGATVIAAEIDRGLAGLVRELFVAEPLFTLIQGDALAGKHALNSEMMAALRERSPAAGRGRKLVSNLPYQIATPLLMELQNVDPPLTSLCCTIQKEVGERLVAESGSAAYGPVSIVTQTRSNVEIITELPPGVFWPRPKVDSIMLRICPRPLGEIPIANVSDFARFVQRAFLHRRKKLRSIMRDWGWSGRTDAIFASASISPDLRPERLTSADWRRLFAAAGSPPACS